MDTFTVFFIKKNDFVQINDFFNYQKIMNKINLIFFRKKG